MLVGMTARIAIAAALALAGSAALAHPGRTDANGCHMERATGTRHCHGGRSTPAPQAQPQRAWGGDVYYPNCSAARAAGAAPIRRGQPGYRPALDRDGDGIACEPYRGR